MTNELSPTELKAIWDDDSLHRVRYEAAVAEGLREPLPEEQLQRLTSFFDGDQTPELLPLWLVFDAYSTHLYGASAAQKDKMLSELRSHGFEPAAADLVLAAAQQQLDDSQELVQELASDSMKFVEVQREAVSSIGPAALQAAIEREDMVALAVATSRDPATLRQWHRNWKRSPVKETVTPIIRSLKDELTQAEWDLFRSFLFRHIAPQISTIDFAREVNS